MKKVYQNSKAVCPKCFRALILLDVVTYNPFSVKLIRRCEACNEEKEIKPKFRRKHGKVRRIS
jgi:hypothetical protein